MAVANNLETSNTLQLRLRYPDATSGGIIEALTAHFNCPLEE